MLDSLALAAPPRVGALEHEVKFILPAAHATPLASWLAAVCHPERAYPPARVVTVYFDTPDLALLGEKIDSDYLKTKVRVRWYAPLSGAGRGVAFAEVKARIGNRREKSRVQLDVDAAELETWRLGDSRWNTIVEALNAAGQAGVSGLAPVLKLTYTRRRFIDPRAAARIALDSDIVATAVHPRVRGRAPAVLNLAVLEAKGSALELSPALAQAVRFGARRGAVSKYLECYRAVTGTIQ
jgi:hypothetical protein